jgi:CHAT domain-containing protein/tetratricopeptide (TPR) repeat protein
LTAQTAPDEATALLDAASKLDREGRAEEALSLCERALALREAALGPRHPDVAEALLRCGALHQELGAYEAAERQLLRSLEIFEAARGPLDADVASASSNLGELYRVRGDYAKAEPYARRALEIAQRILEPGDAEIGASMNNLGLLYWEQGAYDEAEPLLVGALEIAEQAPNRRDRGQAAALNNLAWLYRERSAYAKAESCYQRALEILERVAGPPSRLALTWNGLGGLYRIQGAYAKAESAYLRAREMAERALPPIHPVQAAILNNLGLVYKLQGAWGKAESLYQRALEMRLEILGPKHPAVATTLNNLAELARARGEPAGIEALYLRAIDIYEGAHGKEHPRVALALSSLASHYCQQDAYDTAESLLLRALAIEEKALGPMHPDVAKTLSLVATVWWMQGRPAEAARLISRAAEIREQQLHVGLAHLPESRKRAMMAMLREETDWIVSLHTSGLPRSEPALELALTSVLRRKGRILDSLIDGDAALRAHLTLPLREQLAELGIARGALVQLLYATPDEHGSVDAAAIADARARIDEIEAALSAASAEFRTQSEPVTIAKVQAALPPGAALVEIARYLRTAPRMTRSEQRMHYVAYLVTASGPPQWVDLGPTKPIDDEIDAMLATMRSSVPLATTRAALRRLDGLVFERLRNRLRGATHVILAPDGQLNLVPFEALVDVEGFYGLESLSITYVTSGRDLLRFPSSRVPHSQAVILAGPSYGPSSRAGALFFPSLAGALAEARDLQRYFPGEALTGDKATKAALAALTGPAIVHIATHGFYAGPRSEQPGRTSIEQARDVVDDEGPPRPPPLEMDEVADAADGLDRAGLAMAGANQGADGIVTARELAGFDWAGTQLVVLSACETGIGSVASGDGVYGLRRALVLAGVEAQVVSLWAVSDSSAPELMQHYYGELVAGRGRAEALRAAKMHMRLDPRYEHPYYWAAFIPAGDWRPLDRRAFQAWQPAPSVRAVREQPTALTIDPRRVTCGFLMVPASLVDPAEGLPPPWMVHQALETSQGRFWSAVRRESTNLKIHAMAGPMENAVAGIRATLDKVGERRGRSCVIAAMKLWRPGQSGTDVLAGFCYLEQHPEIYFVGPDCVSPTAAGDGAQ